MLRSRGSICRHSIVASPSDWPEGEQIKEAEGKWGDHLLPLSELAARVNAVASLLVAARAEAKNSIFELFYGDFVTLLAKLSGIHTQRLSRVRADRVTFKSLNAAQIFLEKRGCRGGVLENSSSSLLKFSEQRRLHWACFPKIVATLVTSGLRWCANLDKTPTKHRSNPIVPNAYLRVLASHLLTAAISVLERNLAAVDQRRVAKPASLLARLSLGGNHALSHHTTVTPKFKRRPNVGDSQILLVLWPPSPAEYHLQNHFRNTGAWFSHSFWQRPPSGVTVLPSGTAARRPGPSLAASPLSIRNRAHCKDAPKHPIIAALAAWRRPRNLTCHAILVS
ncbi:hypothetical protein B0H14DRAFT_2589202 [Mycena olivaceomarginata]|nr:hypothetical protein B0H14DRAFT_2589202 [Mycena olivaceomarginata]